MYSSSLAMGPLDSGPQDEIPLQTDMGSAQGADLETFCSLWIQPFLQLQINCSDNSEAALSLQGETHP